MNLATVWHGFTATTLHIVDIYGVSTIGCVLHPRHTIALQWCGVQHVTMLREATHPTTLHIHKAEFRMDLLGKEGAMAVLSPPQLTRTTQFRARRHNTRIGQTALLATLRIQLIDCRRVVEVLLQHQHLAIALGHGVGIGGKGARLSHRDRLRGLVYIIEGLPMVVEFIEGVVEELRLRHTIQLIQYPRRRDHHIGAT